MDRNPDSDGAMGWEWGWEWGWGSQASLSLRCPSGYGFPYPGSKISTSSSKMETVHVLVIYVVNSDVLNSGIHLSTDAKDIVYRKTPILTAFFGQKLAKVRKTVPYHDDIVKS